MNNEFKEPHLRQMYKLLGHEGYTTRLGALDTVTKDYQQVFAHTEQEVVDYARSWNGKRNIFIGRAFRSKDGSVLGSNVVSFDIDPIRDGAGVTASTPEQYEAALRAGRFVGRCYPGGYLATSGNGALLLYRVDPAVAAQYDKIGALIKELNERVKDYHVKVDPTAYDEAVVKLMGALSVKGDPELHRCARFIDWPSIPFKKSAPLTAKLGAIPSISTSAPRPALQGDPVKRISDAKRFLDSIPKARIDDYDSWLRVGMALKEFGLAGLSLWKEWSKKGDKYEEGICETKWSSFDEIPSVGLGTLAFFSEPPKAPNYFEELFKPDDPSRKSIGTGIKSLDSALGPLRVGEIATFAARSGFGKTTFACSVADNLRRDGKRVLYFTTEISSTYIMHKLTSIGAQVPFEHFLSKKFTEAEVGRIKAYERQLLLSPLIIINDEFRPSLALVEEEVKHHKPDVLIFDHFTQVSTNWNDVAEFVRGVKELTSEQQIVTIGLSMLNEPGRNSKGEENKSIRGDVRGSQEIIFLSDIYAFFSNPYVVQGTRQPVEVNITKNRYGNGAAVVNLLVDKEISQFREGDN